MQAKTIVLELGHSPHKHPTYLKSSLPFSQLLRVKCNSTKPEDYHRETDLMLTRFRRCGYPKAVHLEARRKADAADRNSLLAPKATTTRKADRLTLVTSYIPGQTKLFREKTRELYEQILKEPVVSERLPNMREPLPTLPPRLAFHSGASLGNPFFGPTRKEKILTRPAPAHPNGRPTLTFLFNTLPNPIWPNLTKKKL